MGSIPVVNEHTTYLVTASFADADGLPVTPASGTVRLDDASSGTVIRASAPFTPSAATHEFVITALENAILNATLSAELRILTLTFVYGIDSKQGTAQYLFFVRNLLKLS